MKLNYLGGSGLRVSEYCLGTMTWGVRTDATEAARILGVALDHGVNFIDTADSYAESASESILGDLLGQNRDELVIATKFTNAMGGGANDSGGSRIHMMKAVEDSLKRLKTDRIDVYYIHHVDDNTPLHETLRGLDDLVRQGKILYVACSNFEAWRVCEAAWTCSTKGYSPIVCYQGQYSLVVRDLEAEVIPVCDRKGIGLVAYGALAQGFLGGRYQPGSRSAEDSRSSAGWVFLDNMFQANADETLKVTLEIAAARGVSPAVVALSWVRDRKIVDSVLVGPRTAVQLEQSLGMVDFELTEAETERLTSASTPALRYPMAMESGQQARRDAALGK